MHFYFKTIFVRTADQKAEYDKDTKEKSYSILRMFQVLLKNFEQYSIPTSLLIYITAFIAFIYYKLSVLTADVITAKKGDGNIRVKTKDLIKNLNDHFNSAKKTAFETSGVKGKDSGNKELDTTLFGFISFFAYIVVLVYVCASLLLYIVKFVIRLQSFTSSFLFFINILIVLLFIGIAFKIVENKFDFITKFFGPSQLKLLLRILKTTIFYIPCLVTDIVANLTNTTKDTKKLVYIVLFVEICLVSLNTIVPVIDRLISKHLGSVILRKPVYLNNDNHYGNNKYQFGSLVLNTKKELRYKIQSENYGLYEEGKVTPGPPPKEDEDELSLKDLNILKNLDILGIFNHEDDDNIDFDVFNIFNDDGLDNDDLVYNSPIRSKYDHNYAMSFWYYINPMNENTSATYSKDALMINFANRPRIEYNHSANKIKLIMRSGPRKDMIAGSNKDEYTHTEIQLQNIPLQKWNHLVINYTSGILDIFMDGELVETRDGVKPLMQEGAILSGQEDGINGRISNVAYYNKPLSKILIDFLYNSNKNKDTPVGGGLITNIYFLLKIETTVVESIRRVIANILAEFLPRKISFKNIYEEYILDLPDKIETKFWHVIDKFLFDYYEENNTGDLTKNKRKTGFDMDLEYRQNS